VIFNFILGLFILWKFALYILKMRILRGEIFCGEVMGDYFHFLCSPFKAIFLVAVKRGRRRDSSQRLDF
jgi:hypothetical protein